VSSTTRSAFRSNKPPNKEPDRSCNEVMPPRREARPIVRIDEDNDYAHDIEERNKTGQQSDNADHHPKCLRRLHCHPMPNGEVEGPPRSAHRAPRAHTVLPRPRRQTDHASRPPPTIVRRPPRLRRQVLELKEPVRSSQPAHSRPQCVWELPRCDRFWDCTKASASVPRASNSSRASASAVAGHCVSLNRHRLTSDAPWQAA
jgi:hypothetical protein